jgi:hypothetical protein
MGLANGTEGRSNARLRSSAVRQSRAIEARGMGSQEQSPENLR